MATRKIRKPSDQRQRLTRQEAADYLGLSVYSLNQWAVEGGRGLPFYRLGRKVIYDVKDLDAYLAANRVEPTT